ncbi:MAG: hypothetical protein WA005_03795 [Candidatus Binataceae bacterium]
MRTLLSLKRMLLPAVSATGVATLIAVMIPAAAHAFSSPTVLSNTVCQGNLQGSTDESMPNGPFVALGSYYKILKTDVAPFRVSGTLTFQLGFYMDASCTSLTVDGQPGTDNQAPCVQTTFATGTATVYKGKDITTKLPPTTLNLTFAPQLPQLDPPNPPAAPGSDPLSGCTATAVVYPMDDNKGKPADASNMTFAVSCPSSAPVGSGAVMTMECEAH